MIVLAQADADLARDFVPYSLTHLLAVVGSVALIVAFAWAGRRWRGTPAGVWLLRGWVVFLVVLQLVSLAFYALWPKFEWGHSLPLELCDLAGIVAVFALSTRRRLLQTMLYYWGVGLSTQAFITPILHGGPTTMRFYMFWLTHAAILASAVYVLAVERYRPRWRDYFVISLVMLAYGAVVIPLDVACGFDYGFVGNMKLETPTIVDVLGPWPLRLVWMYLIMQAVFAGLTVIWWRPAKRAA